MSGKNDKQAKSRCPCCSQGNGARYRPPVPKRVSTTRYRQYVPGQRTTHHKSEFISAHEAGLTCRRRNWTS
ncbi:hypothetical protein DPMN_181267 [Dreissena polymorpha]|uniref:Uncharacterized protein n=1 Tax=Dreissena polymorpha TaxID=45954 RepID=A0A9D4DE46_DREPO|nr:hypothetical protein DPMN_181267 [Dreissena polymorpha]